jgi:hypothetical protein
LCSRVVIGACIPISKFATICGALLANFGIEWTLANL